MASGGREPISVNGSGKGRVMRRRYILAWYVVWAVVFAVVGSLLLPGAASAVEPPPPPVTPAGTLPSTPYYNPSSLVPGSPAWNEWKALMDARLAAAGYGPPKAPLTTQALKPSASLPFKPITPPAQLLTPARAGIAGAGYLVGWAVGNAGLAVYGVATNSDPWAAMCGAAPGLESALADIQRGINFGIGPECAAPVPAPNVDQSKVWTGLEYAGVKKLTYSHQVTVGTQTHYCYTLSGSGAWPVGNVGLGYYGDTPQGANSQLGIANNLAACGLGGYGLNAYWPSNGTVAISSPGAFWLAAQSAPTVKLATWTYSVPDPSRTPNCAITWDDGSTTTGTGTAYKETTGVPSSAAGLGCASAWAAKHPGGGYTGGTAPTRIKVDSTDGTTTTTISDQPVAPMTAEQKTALANPSTAGLVLTKTVDGVTDSCMTWAANCANWWEATEAGTVPTTGTRTYTCTFGGASVALSECGIYRHTFDVRTSSPTITDPVTGEEEEWVTGPATPNPGNTGDPGTMPNGSTDPHGDCMAEWPSAPDPVSWVLHPVKCALVWAFVPRESEVMRLTGELTDMWEETGVGLTVNTMSAWQFVPPPNGCFGVLVPMSTMFGHEVEDFSLLDACPGSPLEQTAQWCFWIVLIGSVINLIKGVTRNVASIVGAKGVGEGEE